MVHLDTNPSQSVNEDVTDDIKRFPTNLYSDKPPLETDFHRNHRLFFDEI
jgi:hypothetical protein